MKQLSQRQEAIVALVQQGAPIQNKAILKELAPRFDNLSRITLVRDLNALVEKGLLKKRGHGRGVGYEAIQHPLIRVVNVEAYFKLETDQRIIQKNRLQFNPSSDFNNLFTPKELERFHTLTLQYQRRLDSCTKKQIQKELERITIEFSWKSSRIEGNTYSLLDTERLIKSHEEAKGHTREEAVMILNHKAALDYIWKYSREFRTLSIRKIEEIHALIVKNLGVTKGLRKRPVGIIGTRYRPLDNQYQIRETLEDLIGLVNQIKDPFLKSMIAIIGISYIQPFEDGNKRTSRVLGNALLIAHRGCPLSYRGVDEVEYKKAIILFYEQHSLAYFKKIFAEQYQFAVENYFL